jgi:hypothetical protein
MKEIKNLQSYQNETRAWRDKKVKLKRIKSGDLVLLQSPRTEASEKLEPKRIGQWHKQQDQDHFVWLIPMAGSWSTLGMPTNSVVFMFS